MEIKFKFYYSDGRHFIKHVFDFEGISNGEPFEVLSDSPFVGSKNYKNIAHVQYIGLKDKDGTEIFEGDILDADDSSATVIIEFRGGQFVGINTDKDSPIIETQNRNWLNWFVIGNIYQNPEYVAIP